MPNAVLFKSDRRFSSFSKKLDEYGVKYTVLDFEKQDWIDFNYSDIDFIIYFPSFKYSSSHPLALSAVYDNLSHIHARFPKIKMFPDPEIIKYYNDKYRQYLFLRNYNFPIPETYPLFSEESMNLAEEMLGYPMIIKNRFGAGGDYVFRINSRKELEKYYNISRLNLFNPAALIHYIRHFSKREFFYHLIKAKKMAYPFLSTPLLAQRFVKIDRDLKSVVGGGRVVEAHWRFPIDESMWKMNIDGGGIGEWSKIPQEALDLSVNLARDLNTNWLNIDMIISDGKFLITEFSPVWHHYAYKEKPSFIYKDDYNIDVPLEIALDLERIIIESFLEPNKGI